MKKILFIAMLLVSIVAISQESSTTILLPKQTTVTHGKTTFKVITSNDSVIQSLARDFAGKYTKCGVALRKDRFGQYYEYTFFFPVETYGDITKYFKSFKQ